MMSFPREGAPNTLKKRSVPGLVPHSESGSGMVRTSKKHKNPHDLIERSPLGLLKSGKVELRRTIDQGNLRKLLGI